MDKTVEKIQIARGDRHLKTSWFEGELFWQFPNQDKEHPFSEGQLFIQSKDGLEEVANRRSIDAFRFRGDIGNFDGDFLNADLSLYPNMAHAHVGDIWRIDSNIPSKSRKFGKELHVGDLILITEVTEESIEWTVIVCPEHYNKDDDLDATTVSEAIRELSHRMLWCGEIGSAEEFNALEPKHTGSTYYVSSDFEIDGEVYSTGSILVWDGVKFNKGRNAYYSPNAVDIDLAPTLSDYHKELLKSAKTWSEAIHILNTNKAELGPDGKIILAQLPASVLGTLKYKGVWDPIKTLESQVGINSVTLEAANNPDNQDEYPANPVPGNYYVVSFADTLREITYIGENGEPVKLRNGDYIIWTDADGVDGDEHWDIIHNSSIRSMLFELRDHNGVKGEASITELPKFTTNDKVLLDVSGNTVKIYGDRLVSQDEDEDGIQFRVPIYNGKYNELKNSDIINTKDLVSILNNFSVGSQTAQKDSTFFGDILLKPTSVGTQISTPHSYGVENYLEKDGTAYKRIARIFGSTRVDLSSGKDESIDIKLPEASSTIAAILDGTYLLKNRILKSTKDGFVESTSIQELDGLITFLDGLIQSDQVNTNVIKFYDGKRNVFLKVHPDSLFDKTTLLLPNNREEATLATIEDITEAVILAQQFNVPQVSYELLDANGNIEKVLVDSPITSHVYDAPYKDKNGKTQKDKTDLSSIPSYKGSSLGFAAWREKNLGETPTQAAHNKEDSSLSFDAWVHSARGIASEEALLIPSEKGGDKYTAIIPSKTEFKNDPSYQDIMTNELKDQNVEKTVEAPAESGVMLTSNSNLECGVIISTTSLEGLDLANFGLTKNRYGMNKLRASDKTSILYWLNHIEG